MRYHATFILAIGFACAFFQTARAASINVKAPHHFHATAGEAKPKSPGPLITGEINADQAVDQIRFSPVVLDTEYDLKIVTESGMVFQGINTHWYSLEPPKPDSGAMNDDDRAQIGAIVSQVLSFYNRSEILLLQGNHDRAVALVQLVRDKAFHSDKGGEIIWHIELWYFRNQHGGWEKVQQANKIIRRERFTSEKEYHAAVDHLRWVAELGGLKVAREEESLTVTLPADADSPRKTETGKTEAPSDTSSTQAAK